MFGGSSEKAAADARVNAADARVNAADANARVKAADAHVKAADARVAAADAGVVARGCGCPRENHDKSGCKSRCPRRQTESRDSIRDSTKGVPDRCARFRHEFSRRSFPGEPGRIRRVDGAQFFRKGPRFKAVLSSVEDSGRVKGRASIRLALTDIMQGNRMVPITTETFVATADSSTTRDAEIIAGGAGVGAVIGAVAGGAKGAGIGAATGGGAGTGVVLATKGKEIHYGPETRLNFTLTNSVEM